MNDDGNLALTKYIRDITVVSTALQTEVSKAGGNKSLSAVFSAEGTAAERRDLLLSSLSHVADRINKIKIKLPEAGGDDCDLAATAEDSKGCDDYAKTPRSRSLESAHSSSSATPPVASDLPMLPAASPYASYTARSRPGSAAPHKINHAGLSSAMSALETLADDDDDTKLGEDKELIRLKIPGEGDRDPLLEALSSALRRAVVTEAVDQVAAADAYRGIGSAGSIGSSPSRPGSASFNRPGSRPSSAGFGYPASSRPRPSSAKAGRSSSPTPDAGVQRPGSPLMNVVMPLNDMEALTPAASPLPLRALPSVAGYIPRSAKNAKDAVGPLSSLRPSALISLKPKPVLHAISLTLNI